jgi:hypothetical protein
MEITIAAIIIPVMVRTPRAGKEWRAGSGVEVVVVSSPTNGLLLRRVVIQQLNLNYFTIISAPRKALPRRAGGE